VKKVGHCRTEQRRTGMLLPLQKTSRRNASRAPWRWHCPDSTRNRIYAPIGRPDVCLSVQAGAHSSKPAARPVGDCCETLSSSGRRRSNAGSAMLSAYVRSWTQTSNLLCLQPAFERTPRRKKIKEKQYINIISFIWCLGGWRSPC